MKQLKFVLKTNNDIVIDKEVNYILKENILKFTIDETLYEYDIDSKIMKKKDKESLIEIDFNKSLIIITVLDINYSVDMEINDVIVQNKDNEINLKYTFMNDEKTTNCILIKY